MKPVLQRMHDDQHTSPPYQGFPPIEVKEIAQGGRVDQDRVQNRVDVVGTQVGRPGHQYIRLALHRHRLLAEQHLQGLLMHRLGDPRRYACDAIGRPKGLKNKAP